MEPDRDSHRRRDCHRRVRGLAVRASDSAPRHRRTPCPCRRGCVATGTDNPAGTIAGSAEVPGNPDELSAKLTERLARDGLGFLGPIKITGADRKQVSFEAIGNTPGGSGNPPANLRRGVVRFSGAGNKTRIEYRVEAGSGRVLLALGWFFLALGLAAPCDRPLSGIRLRHSQPAVRHPRPGLPDDSSHSFHLAAVPVCPACTAAGQTDPGPVRGAGQQLALRVRPAIPVDLDSARAFLRHAMLCRAVSSAPGEKSKTSTETHPVIPRINKRLHDRLEVDLPHPRPAQVDILCVKMPGVLCVLADQLGNRSIRARCSGPSRPCAA